jgi:lipopolysaccharide cholinephosphotransferase
MTNMNIKKFKKIQSIQLEILKYFDEVARENNITYYMAFGSLIGAVRHQGFIPWDVDIDITLFREDYEKIIEILKAQEEKTDYFIRKPGDKYHISPHALLYCKETEIFWSNAELNKQDKRPRGVYIDLFPIDKLSENPKLQNKHINRILRMRNHILIKNPTYYKKGKIYRFLKWSRSMLFLFSSTQRMQLRLDKEMQKYNNTSSKLYGQYACPYTTKIRFEKDVYGKPKLVPFSGIHVPIPNKYNIFLSTVYGDYMKLPSEENQKRFYNNNFTVHDNRKKQ